MCRRSISIALAVFLSFSLLVSSALASDDLEGTEFTTDQSIASLFGFDDDDLFDEFCIWLVQQEVSDADEMQDILDASPWSDRQLNGYTVFQLYVQLRDLGISTLSQASGTATIIIGTADGTANAQIKVDNQTVQIYAPKGTWSGSISSSASGTSTVLFNLSNFVTNTALSNTLSNYVAKADVIDDLDEIAASVGILQNTLSYLWRDDTGRWDALQNVSGSFYLNDVLRHLSDTVFGFNWLMYHPNSVASFYDPFSSLNLGDSGYKRTVSVSDYGFLGAFAISVTDILSRGLFNSVGSGVQFLNADGSFYTVTNPNGATLGLVPLVRSGFMGLNANTEFALVGGHGNSVSASFFSFDEDLNRTEDVIEYDNLLTAIVGIGQLLQRPLSQLQAVLANDDELKLRQDTNDEVDAINDNFTGDGGAAPSVGDIGDMANISTDFSGMFDSGVGPGEFVGVVNGGDTYSFFSQEVADSLDQVGGVSSVSLDDPVDDLFDLSGYRLDDDGFLVLADDSFFSVSDFLGGEE